MNAISTPNALSDTVCEVPWRYMQRYSRLLMFGIDIGFPSSAADDLEEPIDLATLLVEHLAASYMMRVSGWSMVGAQVNRVIKSDRAVVACDDRVLDALDRPG